MESSNYTFLTFNYLKGIKAKMSIALLSVIILY